MPSPSVSVGVHGIVPVHPLSSILSGIPSPSASESSKLGVPSPSESRAPSSLFGIPSPSQSAAIQIALLISGVPEPPTHGSFGKESTPFGVPSPSQSASFHACVAFAAT